MPNKTMNRISYLVRDARYGGRGGTVGGLYSVEHGDGSEECAVVVKYRGTAVATLFQTGEYAGCVRLQTGGWRTMTTKAVMNAALWETPYSVYQKQGVWYVERAGFLTVVEYRDGMMLGAGEWPTTIAERERDVSIRRGKLVKAAREHAAEAAARAGV